MYLSTSGGVLGGTASSEDGLAVLEDYDGVTTSQMFTGSKCTDGHRRCPCASPRRGWRRWPSGRTSGASPHRYRRSAVVSQEASMVRGVHTRSLFNVIRQWWSSVVAGSRVIRTKDVQERVLQAEELVSVGRHDVSDVMCCLRVWQCGGSTGWRGLGEFERRRTFVSLPRRSQRRLWWERVGHSSKRERVQQARNMTLRHHRHLPPSTTTQRHPMCYLHDITASPTTKGCMYIYVSLFTPKHIRHAPCDATLPPLQTNRQQKASDEPCARQYKYH